MSSETLRQQQLADQIKEGQDELINHLQACRKLVFRLANQYGYDLDDLRFVDFSEALAEATGYPEMLAVIVNDIDVFVQELKETVGGKNRSASVGRAERKAISHFRNLVTYIESSCSELTSLLPGVKIRHSLLVPPQQPAPIKVVVAKGRLLADVQQTNIGVLQKPGIERIILSTANTLRSAVSAIEQSSNSDQRVVPILSALVENLSSGYAQLSPEATGLNAQIVKKALNRCRNELPDLPILQIEEALSSTQVILSQFEEWRLYKIAEAAATITPDQTSALVEQAYRFVDNINSDTQKDIVDPTISRRLNEIVNPLRAAIVDYDMMVAPLYTSMNNIFAGLIEAILQFQQTESLPHGATLALAALAYGYLKKFAEPLDKFPPLQFVRVSLEWIEKYTSFVKNVS